MRQAGADKKLREKYIKDNVCFMLESVPINITHYHIDYITSHQLMLLITQIYVPSPVHLEFTANAKGLHRQL